MVFSEAANMEEPVYDATKPFPILNAPGKTILGIKVHFPPDAATPPHTHAGAFVAVTVLSGSVLNKMNDSPMTIKKTGDTISDHN